MRDVIAAGFDCEVFDKYGSRETSIVAHESPAHAGMCIQAEHTYVEFLDANDMPCVSGQPGRLIVTTLNNLAQPLLRYETTDVAAPLDGSCPSGLGLPMMTSVTGRLHDVICGRHGELVHPQLFSNVMRQFANVRWFQVIQHEPGHLIVRLVTDNGAPLCNSACVTISDLIRGQSGVGFAIDYESLADMPEPSTATGKYRLCVSSVPVGERGGLNALRACEPLRAGFNSAQRTEKISWPNQT
jgi:phenylacetate-CoA ligase